MSVIHFFLLLLVVVLAGCAAPATPDTRPVDLYIAYEWQEGSLPPPFHYEYSITVQPAGQGEIVMVPDYPKADVPVWTEGFTVTPHELDTFYQTLVTQGLFTRNWQAQSNPPVGGSTQSARVTAKGRQIEIPAFVNAEQDTSAAEIFKAINALVPQTVWDKLEMQREQYAAEH